MRSKILRCNGTPPQRRIQLPSGRVLVSGGRGQPNIFRSTAVLRPAMRAARQEKPGLLAAAAGVSCRAQIEEGAGCLALHPLELAAARLIR